VGGTKAVRLSKDLRRIAPRRANTAAILKGQSVMLLRERGFVHRMIKLQASVRVVEASTPVSVSNLMARRRALGQSASDRGFYVLTRVVPTFQRAGLI